MALCLSPTPRSPISSILVDPVDRRLYRSASAHAEAVPKGIKDRFQPSQIFMECFPKAASIGRNSSPPPRLNHTGPGLFIRQAPIYKKHFERAMH
ncbi:hypothetical protein NMY22_g3313 [Coprinellus aureogranulatus]|nr:hypothetical protein NMY22_g3313 [Coprinellus aureogranulatus]